MRGGVAMTIIILMVLLAHVVVMSAGDPTKFAPPPAACFLLGLSAGTLMITYFFAVVFGEKSRHH
jgi:hypothetical protein